MLVYYKETNINTFRYIHPSQLTLFNVNMVATQNL